jgi:hypothetical protein
MGYIPHLFKTCWTHVKGLSSEIYFAESGINRQVTLKGRGAEVFRGFCPSPLMWEALYGVGAILYKIWDMINQFPITLQSSDSGLFLTLYFWFPNSANTLFGKQFQRRYEILELYLSYFLSRSGATSF